METSILKIGNSKGVIIPKRMLSRLGNSRKWDIQLKDGGLFIAPIHEAREGWEQLFASAAGESHEGDIFDGTDNEFDREEWTW